jgi:hypothetical protein
MATEQSIPQSIAQSKLTVVPFPAPQDVTKLAARLSNGALE